MFDGRHAPLGARNAASASSGDTLKLKGTIGDNHGSLIEEVEEDAP
jgi:hypothetical protein